MNNRVYKWEDPEGGSHGFSLRDDKGHFLWASYKHMRKTYVSYAVDPSEKRLDRRLILCAGIKAKEIFAKLFDLYTRQQKELMLAASRTNAKKRKKRPK